MQDLYESAWHNPLSFWGLQLALFAVLVRARGRLRDVLLFFTGAIAVDALLSGALSPIAAAPQAVKTGSALAFVLLGDFRFFFLTARFAGMRASAAVALAFAVPVLVIPLVALGVPERLLWFTFEVGVALLAATLRLFVWPRRDMPLEHRRYVHDLTLFEIAQYGLWVTADVLLLSGHAIGWAVRLLPNTLYYGGFLAFAWWRAPAAAKQGDR